ncbi:MAG TPA: hypothetical protein VLF18_03285 [Tahibacter sp.]|uniref:hypothetical protein n=1 Tax=Tahibacter sp. TaxID=2056211 RepID=UPI002BDB6E2E|nr:hypothetical protein [Tahibacter sp.]HSX59203.1 hypothetical protein [Tahibacter sp.]
MRHVLSFLFAVAALAAAIPSKAAEVSVDATFYDDFEQSPQALFRLGQLQLRDPHVFVPINVGPISFCGDATDTASVGLNAQIAASLGADADANGRYDTSPLLVFAPFRTDGRRSRVSLREGDCSVATPLQCVPAATGQAPRYYQTFSLGSGDYCAAPIAGTTSTWAGGIAIPQPAGQCYATTLGDFVLSTGTVDIPLFDTKLAAPVPTVGASTGGGLLRGFLRASDAATITVPVDGTPRTLASLLPGGAGSCQADVAGGLDNWNGEAGWWFYFEYRQDGALP